MPSASSPRRIDAGRTVPHFYRSLRQIKGAPMKPITQWTVAMVVVCVAGLTGVVTSMAADAEQREAAARGKDSSWKPACTEVAVIRIGDHGSGGSLKNFCLNGEGNILACVGPAIRIYSPKGDLLKTLALD